MQVPIELLGQRLGLLDGELLGVELVSMKVRTYETAEVIVGAVTSTLEQPTSVIAGRYTPAKGLVIVGRTSPPTINQARALAAVLSPTGDHPWPTRISAGGFGGTPVDLIRVQPAVVAEVAGDAAQRAGRLAAYPERSSTCCNAVRGLEVVGQPGSLASAASER